MKTELPNVTKNEPHVCVVKLLDWHTCLEKLKDTNVLGLPTIFHVVVLYII